MANEPSTEPTAGLAWQAKQVYAMAVICLVVGLAIGYLFRGSQSPAAPHAANSQASAQPSAPPGGTAGDCDPRNRYPIASPTTRQITAIA